MNRRANDRPDSALKADEDDQDAEQVVVAYHERTKHHYHRYSASLGYLDWAQQPDPFRRYNGAPLLRLTLPEAGRALPYWHLYVPENVAPAPLSVDAISLFFRYALSLTAWKGSRERHGLYAPIRRAGTCTRRRGTCFCRPWTL